MTTDITELAQRLKLEVHRAVSDFNPQMNIKTRDLKELVEALESEKRICATWRKTAEANSEKLEKAQQQTTESENRVRKQNRHICELFDDNTALRQRIAGLEARTVKLPKPISVLHRREFTAAHCAIYAYPEAEVNAALDGAGIKWEAE
ncbi:RelE family toxin-antitoxin system (fragment) [Klebsiella pneumoniae]